MADETLYGCINWTTGKVKFDQDDCTYDGCMIWSGVHAGQVAVTVLTPYCDDVYYGCVDWATGKFAVSVPEGCCIESCPHCPLGTTPRTIQVKVTGVTDCTGCLECPCLSDCGVAAFTDEINVALDINGTWICNQVEGLSCVWVSDWNTDVSGSIGACGTADYVSPCVSPCSSDVFEVQRARCQIYRYTDYMQVSIILQIYISGVHGCNPMIAKAAAWYIPEAEGDACILCTEPPQRYHECVSFVCGESPVLPAWGFTEGGTVAFLDCCPIAPSWALSVNYSLGNVVKHAGDCYVCIQAHTSSSSDEPGVGVDWADYWAFVS